MKFVNRKHGISLIAVLMFMLAATTASIVVFRYLGEENFLSGARLKQSEAYQASESGLDAVQSWLTNRAADAGDLVREYVLHNKSILMTQEVGNSSINVLGQVGGSRSQNFRVYLIGVDEKSKPMKLKFLSIGEARDGSKVSQSAIFSVDGLYKISAQAPKTGECTVDFKDALWGKTGPNTQGNWSNATINTPDYIGSSIRTSGDFVATGNVELVSGTFIGLDSTQFANDHKNASCPADLAKAGDSYIAGDLKGEQLTFCGNVYVGGNVTVNGAMIVKGDLYVAGNLTLNQNLEIDGNLTIGGSFSILGNNNITVKKDLLVLPSNVNSRTFQLSTNGSKIEGNVWIPSNVVLVGDGKEFQFATESGSKLYMSDVSKKEESTTCPGSNCQCKYNDDNSIYFKSPQGCDATEPITGPSGNQIPGANTLDKLRSKVVNGKVPDPLELPNATKNQWLQKAGNLLEAANKIVLDRNVNPARPPENGALPASCVYLFKTEDSGGSIPADDYCRSIDVGCSGEKFKIYLSSCYEELRVKECGSTNPTYLYKGGDECYLPIKLAINNPVDGSGDSINGNFILIFDPKPTILRLPSTTSKSKALVYLPEGAGTFEVNNTDGNYFIFADKDIDKASGSGHIKGTIFMSKESTIGSIPDTKITFNQDLFQALLDAGILKGTDNPDNENCNPITIADDYYIPVSSRLSVKLENKEISKEKAPEGANKVSNLDKSILVMPRVVRLAKNELEQPGQFRHFYTYMYLNGANSENESANEPTCGFESSSGSTVTLNTNGDAENTEGLYVCTFSGTSIRHSNFYVNVSGEKQSPKINISPENGIIQKSKIGTPEGYIKVSLIAEEENPVDNWRVKISVEGNLWNIQQIGNSCPGGENDDLEWFCIIPMGQTTADVLRVGPKLEVTDIYGTPRDKQIVLKISHDQEGYQIDETKNTSTIIIHSKTARVLRDDPKEQYVDCPHKPDPWVSVSCPDYALDIENQRWYCEINENATWRVDEGEACKVVGSNNATNGTITVFEEEEELNHFTVGLEWKSYKLTVSGLDEKVYIETSDLAVPSEKRKLTCNGTTGCDVYHGAIYTISRTGDPVEATCASSFCPSGKIYYLGEASGNPLTVDLTPTDNVEIQLKNIADPVVTECILTDSQQKIGASFSMSSVAKVSAIGYDCENKTVTYSISGTKCTTCTLTDAGPYTVSAEVTCNNLTSPPKACTPQLEGVPALPPRIECTGGSNWYVGSQPIVSVKVTNGEVMSCEKAIITGWTSATIPNQNPEEATDYTFTKDVPIDAEGPYSITARVTCRNSILNDSTLTEICAYTAQDHPPCEYKKEWCGNADYSTVTQIWSSNGKNNGCYFVKSIDKFQGSIKVNGINFDATCGQSGWGAGDATPCADKLISAGITKAEGGYYIYQQSGLSNTQMTSADALHSYCSINVTCTWEGSGKTMFTGDTKPNDPSINCSSGTLTINGLHNEPPSSLSSNTTYHLTADVKCGNIPVLGVDCGTLTVLHKPEIKSCGAENFSQEVTLPDLPIPPMVELNDQSNVCSDQNSNTPNSSNWAPIWTVSKGGTDESGTWNDIFTEAGNYVFRSVSGTCGNYPTLLTHTCSGSAEVKPTP